MLTKAENNRKSQEAKERSPLRFILLVFAFSIPFWYIGASGAKLTKAIPINLPISALGFVCTFSAALILTYQESKSRGVVNLLKTVFDYERTSRKGWFVPAILLMPAIMILSYVVMDLIGPPLPALQVSVQIILVAMVLVLAFFVAALCEEIGWSGYAIDPMQNRWGAFQASVILGCVWALWHVIPYLEANNSIPWVEWQCVFTVGARVIIVWLYNNAGKSLLAATLFHTTINVSTFLFPIYGSYYDPEITAIITLIFAMFVAVLWIQKKARALIAIC
jgi:hypothetical protein